MWYTKLEKRIQPMPKKKIKTFSACPLFPKATSIIFSPVEYPQLLLAFKRPLKPPKMPLKRLLKALKWPLKGHAAGQLEDAEEPHQAHGADEAGHRAQPRAPAATFFQAVARR